MRTYELAFILTPELKSDQEERIVEQIKNDITKDRGEITKLDNWGKRDLSYNIRKFSEGKYYLLDFTLNPENLQAFERKIKLADEVIRYLIIKTEGQKKEGKRVEENIKIKEDTKEKIKKPTAKRSRILKGKEVEKKEEK